MRWLLHVLSVTDWEKQYQTGETPWDKGQPAPPLLELFDRGLPGGWEKGAVLAPGCGLGHDVREIARRGYQVVGVDISPTAVERARQLPAAGTETFELGNLFDPAWQAGRKFSGWWEHTCFCAIPPDLRAAYAEAAGNLVEKDGLLAGVFYLTPNGPGEKNVGPPFNTSVEEIEGLLAPWFEKIDGWVPSRCYPGREGQEWLALFRRRA